MSTKDMRSRLSRIQNWEALASEADFQASVIAALCSVSLRQLERFFIARFHRTPQQWVRDTRVEFARQLIAKGFSDKAVAIQLHFGGSSHLCHEFKRVYGTSPQSFAPIPKVGARPNKH
ncbi:MAG TPA: helix-turn-helix domain-containing protein [Verrucomicrobiae bacterium]|nr:helix-turn-helix domain-containing protein [Verrucomicrobiae bacterium]